MPVRVGWTQADLDSLRAAIASGVLTVSFSGPPSRTVTYQSTAAMVSVLGQIVAEVSDVAGNRRTHRYATHKKGFD